MAYFNWVLARAHGEHDHAAGPQGAQTNSTGTRTPPPAPGLKRPRWTKPPPGRTPTLARNRGSAQMIFLARVLPHQNKQSSLLQLSPTANVSRSFVPMVRDLIVYLLLGIKDAQFQELCWLKNCCVDLSPHSLMQRFPVISTNYSILICSSVRER